MKIIDMHIDWMQGYTNDPKLILLIEHSHPSMINSLHNIPHIAKDGGLGCTFYYAEDLDTGLVHFCHHDPRNETGFGGAVVRLRMKDGSIRNIKGPWSSRSGVANQLGFGPCIEAIFKTKQSPGGISGAITVAAARAWLSQYQPYVVLVKTTNKNLSNNFNGDREFWFVPSLEHKEVIRPK